jgi:hypothetical protein
MISITPNLIDEMECDGLSWKVRLEYIGPNKKTKSGRSAKWWSCNGHRGVAYTTHGAIGSGGSMPAGPFDVETVKAKIRKKLKGGYKVEGRAIATAPRVASEPTPPPLTGLFSAICRLELNDDRQIVAVDEGGVVITIMPAPSAESFLRTYSEIRRQTSEDVRKTVLVRANAPA